MYVCLCDVSGVLKVWLLMCYCVYVCMSVCVHECLRVCVLYVAFCMSSHCCRFFLLSVCVYVYLRACVYARMCDVICVLKVW